MKVTRLFRKLLQIQFDMLSETQFRGVCGEDNVAE